MVKAGVCVSCGRESGRYYRVCPYCSEQVWQPVWRRVFCAMLLALPPLALAALVLTARPDFMALAGRAASVWNWVGFLFAAGAGLLLMPYGDDDLVVTSRADLVRWQALALCGSVLCGLYAAAGAVCVTHGQRGGAGVWIMASALATCVSIAPFFFRIPWRSLIAVGMIVAAVALG
jgi:hypothetical protein